MSALFGRTASSPIPVDWGTAACLDLVNSRFTDHLGSGTSYDRLPLTRFRRELLKRWGFAVDDPDSPAAVEELAQLRKLLRRVLEGYIVGRPLSPTERRELESQMNRSPIRLRIELAKAGARLHQSRTGSDWDVVLAEIATSAVSLISEYRIVKVCANPSCSWMFEDESHAHIRRWCNTAVCGSLINVRRYRVAHSR
jgi:predicted RNA-binding Zn ribbon-like protein